MAAPKRGAAAGEGIEHAYLDVGVMPQMQEPPVLARRIEIIHQHAHAHPPVGRAAHMLQQEPGRFVLMDDVVLDVERALGMIGERDQTVESFIAGEQQPDSR